MFGRAVCKLRTQLAPTSLTGPLLLTTFCAGVLDTTTYFNFGTFASNQTGCVIPHSTILQPDETQKYPNPHFGIMRSASR